MPTDEERLAFKRSEYGRIRPAFPSPVAEAICEHTQDFEWTLKMDFDPQGRDDRPFTDAEVKCWLCGKTWRHVA